MASPADTGSDPVLCILESCLRERSGGTMIAAVRDVWLMAQRQGVMLSYQATLQIFADCGRYSLQSGLGVPMMIRPL